jgi:hypothetical protein
MATASTSTKSKRAPLPPQFPAPIGGRKYDFNLYPKDGDPSQYEGYGNSVLVFYPIGDRSVDKEKGEEVWDSRLILEPTQHATFDSLGPYYQIRHSSKRGARRNHILQLAAKSLGRDYLIAYPNLDKGEVEQFRDVIFDLLIALVQGVLIQFPKESKEIYYQINEELYQVVCEGLTAIGIRTQQVSSLENPRHLVPHFGDNDRFPRSGIYSHNDWEILACAYKCEVETFLTLMLKLGYDFQPPEITDSPEESSSTEDQDDWENRYEVPGSYITKTPVKLNDRVLSLLQSVTPSARPVKKNPDRTSERSPSAHGKAPPQGRLSFGTLTPPTTFAPESPGDPVRSRVSFDLPQIRHTVHSPAREKSGSPDIRIRWDDSTQEQSGHFSLRSPLVVPARKNPLGVSQVERNKKSPEDVSPETLVDEVENERLSSKILRESEAHERYKTERVGDPHPASKKAVSTRIDDPTSLPTDSIPSYASYQTAPLSSVFSYPAPQFFNRTAGSQIHTDRFTKMFQDSPHTQRGGREQRENRDNANRNPGGAAGNPGDPEEDPNRGRRRPNRGLGHGGNGNGNGNGNGRRPNRSNLPDGGGGRPPSPPRNPGANVGDDGRGRRNGGAAAMEAHFDIKLKVDIVPTWDGDDSTIGQWLMQVNDIANRSRSVFVGLGTVVPTRFKGRALEWWYSLDSADRIAYSFDWGTLRDCIRSYWMNQSWITKTQDRALKASFREPGHTKESPTEFFIRKYELISLVYNYTPAQFMDEFLKKTPANWFPVLNPSFFQDLNQFHAAINEEHLERMIGTYESRFFRKDNSRTFNRDRTKSYQLEGREVPDKNKPTFNRPTFNRNKANDRVKSKSYVIGGQTKRPEYPKDDKTVSKGKTPESVGARGCIHCGSLKHWDRDCKYANKGVRKAKTYFAELSPDDLRAEAEYREVYFASQDASIEDESDEDIDEEVDTDQIEEESDRNEDKEEDF